MECNHDPVSAGISIFNYYFLSLFREHLFEKHFLDFGFFPSLFFFHKSLKGLSPKLLAASFASYIADEMINWNGGGRGILKECIFLSFSLLSFLSFPGCIYRTYFICTNCWEERFFQTLDCEKMPRCFVADICVRYLFGMRTNSSHYFSA